MLLAQQCQSLQWQWHQIWAGTNKFQDFSAFFCGYVITNIAGGYMADKHGGDKIIFYSSFVWSSLSTVIPYFAYSNNSYYSGVTAVIACRFLIGIFQGIFFPSITSIFSKRACF